jgi:Beta-lactamase enzyme family
LPALSQSRRRALALALVGLVALLAAGSLALALRSGGSDAKPRSSVTVTRDQTSYGPKEVPLPTARALQRARSFASGRRGRVSFAVVDTSGRLVCYRCRVNYHSASVVKAMLLVSYLNQLSAGGEPLPPDHKAYLDSMIRVSDNDAATVIYAHVGDEGLNELAWQAQMTDFRVSGSWGSAQITAADQARFFASLDELTAPEYRTYVREVLSSIARKQSWGIPEVSRPEWNTFFKGGWLTARRGSLVHQVARLESEGSSMVIAVLTDGVPSDAYGRETIRGTALRLLAP